MKTNVSLRDYFAAHALTHIAAFHDPDLELPPPALAAAYSYAVADEMLKRRKKRKAKR